MFLTVKISKKTSDLAKLVDAETLLYPSCENHSKLSDTK